MINNLLARLGAGRSNGQEECVCASPVANLGSTPADVVEVLCRYLDVRDTLALAQTCRELNRVATSRRVWAELLQRAFSPEELPSDASSVLGGTAPELRAAYRLLSLQRPAFLSDAPRTSEIMEHSGSRFRKVLHIDGRRDLNFSTVFRGVPPGQYAVVWRLQLQPGFVRGYCNFRAVFSRPRSGSSSSSRNRSAIRSGSGSAAAALSRAGGKGRAARRLQLLGNDRREEGLAEQQRQQEVHAEAERVGSKLLRAGEGYRWRLQRRLKGWLPIACMSGPARLAASEAARVDDFVLEEGEEEELGQGQGQEEAAAAPDVAVPALADTGAAGAAAAAVVVPPHRVASEGQEELEALAAAPEPPLAPYPAQHPEIEIEPFADAVVPAPQPLAQPLPPLQHHEPQQQQQQQQAAPPQLAQAMGQLHSVSVKRDAAYAAGGEGGPRYVHRLLTPLWGGHTSSWRQLDPAGPLGHGGWRRLHMGGLTVRRGADVHLHSVLVQLRPVGAAALAAALPPGEGRWRGALVDYVELVPLRRPGLLESLLPDMLLPSRLRCGGRPPLVAPDPACAGSGGVSGSGAGWAFGVALHDPEMVQVPVL
ncbi:hypothetical protein HYH02_013127 [Chlamydomonas schloesseri]|uniref:F-box domain-containing protein n=1 Tax=Chlamydomonas schloesseri TaxID=2026947 RepID=A0A835VWL7_9CHLO|nr:hypothetical protein HYH02_013127 [Chlamydomonas schloesseri]|eukprot:KAG2432057.1 hypothetical protein HYH02_013127 [Chlamydomonas schloesseri]